ncbi:MAG: hypothetical protein NZ958_01900 [Bacteroidia bacterium]|nr:hypothetical protein [Bacteroidia bacterium]MDW8089096.1 hypothetical protein [Bacteroidia bacterium]
MGTALWGLLGLIYGQVIELQSGKPRLVTFPELGSKRPLLWVALAWRHPPAYQELGRIVAFLVAQEDTLNPSSAALRRQLGNLGGHLSLWSMPEGAAVCLTVPRRAAVEAVSWLYAALRALPLQDSLAWQRLRQRAAKAWTGFALKQEVEWLLRGSPLLPPSLAWPQALAYIQRYLAPESLYVIFGGSLSFREKFQIGRLPLKIPLKPVSDSLPSLAVPPIPDTLIQNLWAYPGYVGLLVEGPLNWKERLAFREAFLSRWQREAPPLQWSLHLRDRTHLLLQARLDGRSYAFLRRLSTLTAQDSLEAQAWQAAFELFFRKVCAHPEEYPDLWITPVLMGDTLRLMDTLPAQVWRNGWPFRARGVWIGNETLALDTLVSTPPPARPPAAAVPDFLWTGPGLPPLGEWAAAFRLFWKPPCRRPCELSAYYRTVRERKRLTEYLHQLRLELIRTHQIPPEALEIYLRPLPVGFPPKAIRFRCFRC